MFVMVIILKNENISMGEVTYDDFMLISFLPHTDDPSTKKIRCGDFLKYENISNYTDVTLV